MQIGSRHIGGRDRKLKLLTLLKLKDMESVHPLRAMGAKLTTDTREERYKKQVNSWRKRRKGQGWWSSCHKELVRRGTCQGHLAGTLENDSLSASLFVAPFKHKPPALVGNEGGPEVKAKC